MPVAPHTRTDPAADSPNEVDASRSDAARRGSPWIVVVVLAVLALPLVVATVALRKPTWYPVLDLAMTELRVRDVGTADTPLIGLPGRIGTLEEQGSHPGPLSFWLLTPTYRLLGSSAWALQAAAVVLNIAAMGLSLAIARRRGGLRCVLTVGAVLATMCTAYGLSVLTEPWNPYMPLLWWVAFLLGAWSVAVGDWRVLPVTVGAASFAAQTHLPYLGLTTVLGAGAIALGAWTTWRRPAARQVALRSGAFALALAAIVWSPVLVDQVTNDPGNVTKLSEHMFEPPEEPVGLRTGARVMLVHLDPSQLLSSSQGGSGSLVDTSYDPYGSIAPGLAVLTVWGVSAFVALRRRMQHIVRLDLVIGGALLLGVYSTSRVFGKLWYYLTLWAWVLGVLALVATAWTAIRVLEDRQPPAGRDRLRHLTTVAPAVVLVAAVAVLTVQAPSVDPPAASLSRGLGLLLDPTEQALRDGVGAATGADGVYAVSWADALYIGSQGYGVVSELERRGLDVRGMPWAKVPLTEHRAIDAADATAVLHFTSGDFIERWRGRDGVVEVAHVDPRTSAERQEYEALRSQVIEDLEAAGRDDLVSIIDANLFGASLDPALDEATEERMARMLELGLPMSVFVAPPELSAFP